MATQISKSYDSLIVFYCTVFSNFTIFGHSLAAIQHQLFHSSKITVMSKGLLNNLSYTCLIKDLVN